MLHLYDALIARSMAITPVIARSQSARMVPALFVVQPTIDVKIAQNVKKL